MEIIKARFRFGSRKEAALRLGISENAIRGHITVAIQRTGATNFLDMVYLLWLRHLWGDGDKYHRDAPITSCDECGRTFMKAHITEEPEVPESELMTPRQEIHIPKVYRDPRPQAIAYTNVTEDDWVLVDPSVLDGRK